MQAEAGVVQVCEGHTKAGLELAEVEASFIQMPPLCSRSKTGLSRRRPLGEQKHPGHIAHPQLLETASFSIRLTFFCRKLPRKHQFHDLCVWRAWCAPVFHSLKIFVCLSVCEPHACRCLHSPEEGSGTPGTGVKTGDCELSGVSAGIWAQVLLIDNRQV